MNGLGDQEPRNSDQRTRHGIDGVMVAPVNGGGGNAERNNEEDDTEAGEKLSHRQRGGNHRRHMTARKQTGLDAVLA